MSDRWGGCPDLTVRRAGVGAARVLPPGARARLALPPVRLPPRRRRLPACRPGGTQHPVLLPAPPRGGRKGHVHPRAPRRPERALCARGVPQAARARHPQTLDRPLLPPHRPPPPPRPRPRPRAQHRPPRGRHREGPRLESRRRQGRRRPPARRDGQSHLGQRPAPVVPRGHTQRQSPKGVSSRARAHS